MGNLRRIGGDGQDVVDNTTYTLEMLCSNDISKITNLTGFLTNQNTLKVIQCSPKEHGNVGYIGKSNSTPAVQWAEGHVECSSCSSELGFQCGSCLAWLCANRLTFGKNETVINGQVACTCGIVMEGALNPGTTPVNLDHGTGGKGKK